MNIGSGRHLRLLANWSICVLLFSSDCSSWAEHATQTLYRGNWIASAGPNRYFRGRWSGQLLPNKHDAANGSWVLLNDRNQTVMEGTWSAQKSARGWQGTWSARITHGRAYAGNWEADLDKFPGETLEDMLRHTMEKQVAGWWSSGRLQGNWWLQGTK